MHDVMCNDAVQSVYTQMYPCTVLIPSHHLHSIPSQDWDKAEYVPDPDAKKPDDWDDDTDGEWEPPMIPNPEYKGEWKPKQIDNPDYQGEWVHPQIPNPEYEADDKLYLYTDFGYVGFDLWQVREVAGMSSVFV